MFVFTLLTTVTATYAYWASLIKVTDLADQSETVKIGTGDTVDSTVTLNEVVSSSTEDLVPSGRVTGTQVESVVFTYTVDWTEDGSGTFGNGTLGTLTVTVGNILVDEVADTYGLVNITPLVSTINVVLNDSGTYNVVITVTLNEPADQTQYLAVAGKNITFDVTFTVVPNEA